MKKLVAKIKRVSWQKRVLGLIILMLSIGFLIASLSFDGIALIIAVLLAILLIISSLVLMLFGLNVYGLALEMFGLV